MRYAIILVVIFSSCSGTKTLTENSDEIKTLTLDLTSIKLHEEYRITPASFETITEEIMMVENIDKNALYEKMEVEVLVKDRYNSMEVSENIDTIYFQNKVVHTYRNFEEIITPARYENIYNFILCPHCDESNGLTFDQICKENKYIKSAVEGEALYVTRSYYKLVMPAKITPVSKSGDQNSISFSGPEKELKKLLNHPKLEKAKYRIK